MITIKQLDIILDTFEYITISMEYFNELGVENYSKRNDTSKVPYTYKLMLDDALNKINCRIEGSMREVSLEMAYKLAKLKFF